MCFQALVIVQGLYILVILSFPVLCEKYSWDYLLNLQVRHFLPRGCHQQRKLEFQRYDCHEIYKITPGHIEKESHLILLDLPRLLGSSIDLHLQVNECFFFSFQILIDSSSLGGFTNTSLTMDFLRRKAVFISRELNVPSRHVPTQS